MKENKTTESLIGINEDHSDNSAFSSSFNTKNRRLIKLEKKLINKAALETELIRGGRRNSAQGFKERTTVTGVFSTLIYDLKADGIGSLQDSDQKAIKNQMLGCSQAFEKVDTIRFIKTNKVYYDRIILLFLKFLFVNQDRMKTDLDLI